ncbi:MAG: 50S ribosomal protein L23 [Opitutales bacterium]
MPTPDNVLKELRVTEKSSTLTAEYNQYTFEVNMRCDRKQVADAIEEIYGVRVARVNIMIQKGKRKRSRTVRGAYGKTPDVKKAIVRLPAGETLDMA